MVNTLNPGEEAQLAQTVEMFEVITQSQPYDYQSLEILKEAYSKLNREQEVVATSKRIAQAYVEMGQLSSAILEYETILQLYPSGSHDDDPDARAGGKTAKNRRQITLGRNRGRPEDHVQDICREQNHYRRGL